MELSPEIYNLAWPLILVLLGWINSYLFEGLQSLVSLVEGLPKVVKQLVVIVEQYVLLKLAVIVGMPLPEALSGFTPEVLLALTTAVVGMGIHVKNKPSLPR